MRQEVVDTSVAIDACSLETTGEVPWWPADSREISLNRALAHVITDIYRHAGHADILRELIDGTVGADRRCSNLPPGDDAWWESQWQKIQSAANQAQGAP